MIIDQLNTHLRGGAATAALRLHRSLVDRGVTSRFWHNEHRHSNLVPFAGTSLTPWPSPETTPTRWLTSVVARRLIRWENRRALRKRDRKFDVFTTPRLGRETSYDRASFAGDIVHLHWIGNMIDYPSFFPSIPAEKPLVWTLHDMNPFTGGCHFSGGCERFTACCGECPQILNPAPNDITQRSMQAKREAFRGVQLNVVAPSRWLLNEARRSSLFSSCRSFHHIPYGIDTDVFAPLDKCQARVQLGLETNRRVVAFGADSVANHRKGFEHLLRAWKAVDGSTAMGVVIGADAQLDVEHESAEIRHLGYIRDPAQQRLFYSAADVFVLPSLEDNLPQMGLEAMACGRPVVAFDSGGIPDYVRPMETGLLAPSGNASALADRLNWLLRHPAEMARLGVTARTMMVNEYSRFIEAAKYIELYRSILGTQERSAA